MGAASIGSTVYAIGGMVPVGGNISIGKVEALDTTTGLWSTKAPLPEPVSDTAAVAIDGKIYLMGGSGSGGHTMANVHVYDAAADSWSTPTTMPIGRRLHSAAVLNGKIYVIGGVDVGFNFLDAVDVYDPASNTWSSAAPTPTFRVFGGAAALEGLIYYVGGFNLNGTADPGIIVYDPVEDAWTPRNALFAGQRAGLGVAEFGGALYAVSGVNESAQVFPEVFKYDRAADAWIPSAPIPHPRYAFGYAVAGASFYAISGLGSIDVGFLGTGVDVLTLAGDATAPEVSAAASPAPNPAGWNNSNVTVTLTATDNEGGSGVKSITYKVVGAGGPSGPTTVNGNTATIAVSAEGSSTIAYFATDNAGNAGVEKKLVVRVDKTAPTGTLSVAPGTLWPPNQRMVTITPSLSASDASGMPVTVSGIAVSSNEPQSAAGDWTVSQTTLQLRAAREGRGSGRVYTVTYTLTDIAGNSANVSTTVTVPHDRGR
jgi:hypothetical protein